MHIVIFVHPDFKGSQSMPRFANMIAEGMSERKHFVEMWTTKGFFFKIPSPPLVKKWLGYIDQFIIFPLHIRRKIKKCPSTTLFVFADQALGPWIPLLKGKPVVIHCHDFLAQRSALGEIPENTLGLTGKIYQRWIRKGYSNGENFISVSKKTKKDLHRFLNNSPQFSQVVYNGLNQDFTPGDTLSARKLLEKELNIELEQGYLLHVGGNQFYKNRKGVLKIYNAWKKAFKRPLPILMVGASPDDVLLKMKADSPFSSSIHFVTGIPDALLKLCYQGAAVFLFPSLEEGFGWPIIEAMASGCPVITTGVAPMSEIGGKNCSYFPRMPLQEKDLMKWEIECAEILEGVLALPEESREKLISSGIKAAKKYDPRKALDKIELAYKQVLETHLHSI